MYELGGMTRQETEVNENVNDQVVRTFVTNDKKRLGVISYDKVIT